MNGTNIFIKCIYSIIILIPSYRSFAQDLQRNELSFSGGLVTNQVYECRLSYNYNIFSFAGLGMSLGYNKQWHANIVPEGSSTSKDWSSWRISDKDKKVINLFIEPTMTLRTPAILRIGNCSLRLNAESGCMIRLPLTLVSIDYLNSQNQQKKSETKSTVGGRIFFGTFRASAELHIQDVYIAVGYGISDWDMFAGYRNVKVADISLDKFYPRRQVSHSVFVKIGTFL